MISRLQSSTFIITPRELFLEESGEKKHLLLSNIIVI